MRCLLLFGLAGGLLAPLLATGAEPAAVPPLSTLAELEAQVPKMNGSPWPDQKTRDGVLRLVESNTLASGDDFFRAANLSGGAFVTYRTARECYELMLAAAAKNKREADNFLPEYWDTLLRVLGRPLRFDAWGMVANSPDPDALALDSAPRVIRAVWLHPVEARSAAAKATDNVEIQKIVDADQAVRQHWSALTAADIKSVVANDHRRNVRIREIVHKGGLHTAKDFANAALVMQHSPAFAGFELAHELAVCSMLLGDKGTGRWLVAATYDRMLNSLGHDQRFGTQGAVMPLGQDKPTLAPTDEAGICDAERLALGCPTLAAKRANFWAPHPDS